LYLYLQEGGHLAKGTRLAEEVAKKASSKIAKGSKLIQNPYKNVDHLIESAGKLERKFGGEMQGLIKGNANHIFHNLAQKHGAIIQVSEKGVPFFKYGDTWVHLTSSSQKIPTIRINKAKKIFKIRVQ
ncbi:MAG: hypothetical protein AAF380_02390, partial [Bacteroidota bacterium]